MIDGLNEIVRNCAATVSAADQADVSLCAAIERCLVVDLVVHADQPCVLVNRCRGRASEQVGVRQALAGLISEGSIGINMRRVTVSDGTEGRTPRESLQNGTHLW